MEKVRPWCGQPSDRGRLRNRTIPIHRIFHRSAAFPATQLTLPQSRERAEKCNSNDKGNYWRQYKETIEVSYGTLVKRSLQVTPRDWLLMVTSPWCSTQRRPPRMLWMHDVALFHVYCSSFHLQHSNDTATNTSTSHRPNLTPTCTTRKYCEVTVTHTAHSPDF